MVPVMKGSPPRGERPRVFWLEMMVPFVPARTSPHTTHHTHTPGGVLRPKEPRLECDTKLGALQHMQHAGFSKSQLLRRTTQQDINHGNFRHRHPPTTTI
ncbi:unnamed protein product [Ectocarpus sp. 12 AP-2014]